jgi:hypothetical protein
MVRPSTDAPSLSTKLGHASLGHPVGGVVVAAAEVMAVAATAEAVAAMAEDAVTVASGAVTDIN